MAIDGIGTLGVVGAGQMGGGIAQVAAQGGYRVLLADASEELAQAGIQRIGKFLSRAASKGRITEDDVSEAMGRITPTSDLTSFSEVDFVVEAVSENFGLKASIFETIDGVAKPGAILASNTSSISITKLAAVTSRPEEFIGMHFMNP
ncbi:MAG TPA: 3-hydroxybutyryl-CoA dehydrogenase, partial [Deltaproteobacteria bacterium]|nr:3-hydroxybutyryl-CoA dehydrogenase [Deltaproteobacteria bacterium]